MAIKKVKQRECTYNPIRTTEKILIIAKNFGEYLWFLAENNLDRNKYIYIDSAINLRGYRNTDIIKIGRYYERKDWPEIRELINEINQ